MVGSIKATNAFGEPWIVIIMEYNEPLRLFKYSHTGKNDYPGIRTSYSVYQAYELEVLTNIFVGEW